MRGVWTDFRTREDGSLATWTAAAAVPLMLAVTYAIDMQGATTQRANVENAADTAVLAAALHGGLTSQQKESFAREQFYEAFSGNPEDIVSVIPSTKGSRVTLDVEARFPTLMSYATQTGNHTFGVTRAAETTSEDTICVLALNETASDAISFGEDVAFSAPNCSVQANSRDSRAISSTSTRTPSSKGFCATGGVEGRFSPAANSECMPVEDPYANVPAPVPGSCEPAVNFMNVDGGAPNPPQGLEGQGGGMTTTIATLPGQTDGLPITIDPGESPNVVLDFAVMFPGTYCGGLTIAGRDVRMMPGEYIMLDGPFVVKDNATVTAQQVLVSLAGSGAHLEIEDGGSIEITAPRWGVRAGIAIMQDRATPSTGSETPRSRLRDGALSMTGTLYLPGHELEVRGGGNLGASAPATSFIVDTVEFRGTGKVAVAVDHIAAGIPAIQPRSDEGARLIR